MQPLWRRFPSLGTTAQYADSDKFTQPEQLQDRQQTKDDQRSSAQGNTDILIRRSIRQCRLLFYLQDFVID